MHNSLEVNEYLVKAKREAYGLTDEVSVDDKRGDRVNLGFTP